MNLNQFIQFASANALQIGDNFSRTVLSSVSGASAGICHDGTRFVVVGDSGLVMTSTNGGTWSKVITNISSVNLSKVAYGAGIYVAISGDLKIYSSTDLATWTLRVTGSGIGGVLFGGGTFVAFGGEIYSSTNGTSWTSRTNPGGGFSRGAYVNGRFLLTEIFASSNQFNMAHSTDGATWTGVTIFSNRNPTGVAYWNGAYVLPCNRSSSNIKYLLYSTDLTSWTNQQVSTDSTASFGLPLVTTSRLVIMAPRGIFATAPNANVLEPSGYGLQSPKNSLSVTSLATDAVLANNSIVAVSYSGSNPVILRSSATELAN